MVSNLSLEKETVKPVFTHPLSLSLSLSLGITPLENKRLQKVDAVIFGHDKFAFEMIHFVASASDKLFNDGTIFSKWEDCFVRGLESLLVECAVIHDDIERDCFVSRVYCWFTEKLAERREVPRQGHSLLLLPLSCLHQ